MVSLFKKILCCGVLLITTSHAADVDVAPLGRHETVYWSTVFHDIPDDVLGIVLRFFARDSKAPWHNFNFSLVDRKWYKASRAGLHEFYDFVDVYHGSKQIYKDNKNIFEVLDKLRTAFKKIPFAQEEAYAYFSCFINRNKNLIEHTNSKPHCLLHALFVKEPERLVQLAFVRVCDAISKPNKRIKIYYKKPENKYVKDKYQNDHLLALSITNELLKAFKKEQDIEKKCNLAHEICGREKTKAPYIVRVARRKWINTRPQDALTLCAVAMTSNDELPARHYVDIAYLHAALDDKAKAVEFFERAFAIKPELSEVFYHDAALLSYELGHWDKAIDFYKVYIELLHDEEIDSDTLDNFEKCFEEIGAHDAYFTWVKRRRESCTPNTEDLLSTHDESNHE